MRFYLSVLYFFCRSTGGRKILGICQLWAKIFRFSQCENLSKRNDVNRKWRHPVYYAQTDSYNLSNCIVQNVSAVVVNMSEASAFRKHNRAQMDFKLLISTSYHTQIAEITCVYMSVLLRISGGKSCKIRNQLKTSAISRIAKFPRGRC